MTLTNKAKSGAVAALVSAMLGLGGCGVDDVEFNGKIFDAVGLNNSSSRGKDPKLAARSPLVVPPGLQSLPQPGSEGPTETGAIAEIRDHDASKVASKEELQRQQAEFCKTNYELPKAQGDDSVDSVKGPLGLCRTSILTAIGQWNKEDTGDETASQ